MHFYSPRQNDLPKLVDLNASIYASIASPHERSVFLQETEEGLNYFLTSPKPYIRIAAVDQGEMVGAVVAHINDGNPSLIILDELVATPDTGKRLVAEMLSCFSDVTDVLVMARPQEVTNFEALGFTRTNEVGNEMELDVAQWHENNMTHTSTGPSVAPSTDCQPG